MGLFDFFKPKDINQGVQEWKENKNSVLLDVRTVEEYKKGHIPGSKNVPLSDLKNMPSMVSNKDTLLFVHCQSGGRSMQAVFKLKQMGYTQVKDIGGIANYKGAIEKK